MLNQAFNNLKRYSSINMDILILIVLLLFFLGSFYLVKINFQNFSKILQDKIQLAVFVKDNIDVVNAQNEIKTKLGKNLKEIVFIDKNTAFDELKKEIGLDLLLDENPLKNHFVLKFYKLDVYETIQLLKSLNFVDEIIHSDDSVETLNKFFGYLKKIFLIFAFFLTVIFIFLFRYTIKIYKHYRRKEFVLWKYLGAKQNFIHVSIFLESSFISIIAAIFAYILLFIFYFLIVTLKLFSFDLVFININFAIILAILAFILANIINFNALKKSDDIKNVE